MYIHTIFCVFVFPVFFSIFELFRFELFASSYALTGGLVVLSFSAMIRSENLEVGRKNILVQIIVVLCVWFYLGREQFCCG